MTLTEQYQESKLVEQLSGRLQERGVRLHVDGMTGSLPSVVIAATAKRTPTVNQLVIAPTKEDAFYLGNDLEALMNEASGVAGDKYPSPLKVMLFPTSYRKAYSYDSEQTDNANVLMRNEVIKELAAGTPLLVVSYPDALAEKVVGSGTLVRNTLRLARGEQHDMWEVVEQLQELGFEREDFVVEPGQYAVRGGIVDVYSFASDNPYRIEFFDDSVDSLRTYDAVTQLSVHQLDRIDIVPNLQGVNGSEEGVKGSEKTIDSRVSLLDYFSGSDIVWFQGLTHICQRLDAFAGEVAKAYDARQSDTAHPIAGTLPRPDELCCTADEFLHGLLEMKTVEYGNSYYFSSSQSERLQTHCEPQPAFNKQFDLLSTTLMQYAEKGYKLLITVSNDSQEKRLHKILDEATHNFNVQLSTFNLSHGFIDHDEHLLCFTDHEIFDRYHKYTVRDLRATHEAMTLKELFELKPGDYVTHIDYGVGRFSGLEKVTHDGKSQELIRLIYKNNDVLYISIHGLHKISRYVGREGEAPTLNRLGSNTWQVLKQKTKRQVKDIARDLIALYAKRKASHGFAFSADCSMQEQLEASFLYEDTPDQLKATIAVKHDMEEQAPMDRLVCGDVGFGKTEVAIRAAFKACADNKRVRKPATSLVSTT